MRTDEHRNEVIAAKCTITALPFTKRSPLAYYAPVPLPALLETQPTYQDIVRGMIVADGNCSRGHRKVRSAIDWTADDSVDAFFTSNGVRVHGKHLQTPTTNNGSAPRHKERSPFVRVGRNETQIRREDDVPSWRVRNKNLDSTCARRISKCLEFIKTFMIPEVYTGLGRCFNVNDTVGQESALLRGSNELLLFSARYTPQEHPTTNGSRLRNFVIKRGTRIGG